MFRRTLSLRSPKYFVALNSGKLRYVLNAWFLSDRVDVRTKPSGLVIGRNAFAFGDVRRVRAGSLGRRTDVDELWIRIISKRRWKNARVPEALSRAGRDRGIDRTNGWDYRRASCLCNPFDVTRSLHLLTTDSYRRLSSAALVFSARFKSRERFTTSYICNNRKRRFLFTGACRVRVRNID